jgi:hypothetical protein
MPCRTHALAFIKLQVDNVDLLNIVKIKGVP